MVSNVSRAAGVLGLVLATTLLAAPAGAGPEQDKAQARQLAIDGVEAFQAGDFEVAIARLEAAEKLFHAPTHLLFLARAQAKLGRLLAARETYRRLEDESLAATAPPAFKKAQSEGAEERAQLETRIPVLVIRVEPPGVEGVEVTVDGTILTGAELDETHVDPGRHRIEVRAGDRVGPAADVDLAAGERRAITLQLPAQASEVAPPPGGEVPEPRGEDEGMQTTTLLGLSAIGVGVAGLGVGAVLGIVALGRSSDADALYEQCGGDAGCSASSTEGREVVALDEDYATLGTVSVIALGAGVALAATGVVLVVVGGDDGAAASDARVELAPTPGGVLLQGRF